MRERYQNGPSMSGADITTRPPDDESDDGRVERGGSEGAYESTTATSYGVGTVGRRHLGVRAVAPLGSHGDEPGRPDVWVPDIAVVGIAAATVLAVWSAEVVPALVVGLVAATIVGRRSRSWWTAMLVVGLATIGGIRSDHAWNGLTPDRLGPYDGWFLLVDDPQPIGPSTRLVVAVDGERFEVWCRGRAQQGRVADWRAGEWIAVSGTRRALARRSGAAGRVAARRRGVRARLGGRCRWRWPRGASFESCSRHDRARGVVDAGARGQRCSAAW